MREFDFYYDVVCPYAYLASTGIAALEARAGARVRWRPVLLGGLFRHVGADSNPNATMPAAKARLNLQDMHGYAALRGAPLSMPEGHPRRTVDAMRLLTASPVATLPALSHALFRAYWVEGRDVADREVLAEIATAHGLDVGLMDAEAAREGLRDATAAAAGLGIFGVPAFGVMTESGEERFFWGQDRMHLVERALAGTAPPYAQAVVGAGRGASVTFFHDFASPYSYLASTQVARILGPTGAELRWRPILVGALFKAVGTPDVPLLAMNAARRRYFARDVHDWADLWGVPFCFPETFPIRSVLPLRVALAAPEASPAIYRAAWADGRDISRPEVLTEVLTEAGLDGAALVARANDDASLKAALRENTEAARAAGACGVPTFLVEKPRSSDQAPEVFWGQDRFERVLEALNR